MACIVFGCVFTGALLGMFFRTLVPKKHLSLDTQDVVKLRIAFIATMAALVLGLLIASAKNTYLAFAGLLRYRPARPCVRNLRADRSRSTSPGHAAS